MIEEIREWMPLTMWVAGIGYGFLWGYFNGKSKGRREMLEWFHKELTR